VGLKPTYGLVSTRGVIPLAWSLDHAGPMTRTVADAAIMLQALAGYDQEEITSRQFVVPNYTTALRGRTLQVRLGISREFFFESLDSEIETAVNEALGVLRKLAASTKEIALPVNSITDRTVIAAEAYAYHADFVAKKPEQYQPPTLAQIRGGADIRTVDYIMAHRELAGLRRGIHQRFETVDAIVTPTTPIAPPTIAAFDSAYRDPAVPNSISDIRRLTLRNTSPFNKYGLPTISVPCGFTRNGLPIGLQISGPNGGEAAILQLAHAYEQATEWHKRRPAMA